MQRRRFLKQGGIVLGTCLIPGGATAAGFFSSVAEALTADGFSFASPGDALLVVVADLHINLNEGTGKTTAFDDQLVAEINGLNPRPTDLAIAGDLIMSHSNAVGEPRNSSAFARAQEEMALARDQILRFRPEITTWVVPGNHDTDNQEISPDLFSQVLARPAYQRTSMGGVPVFFLNSGHAGHLDPTQEAWLINQAASIQKDQEVLIVAHHPSLFFLAAEAGLKRSVAKAFAGWNASVFLIGGHAHSFQNEAYLNYGTRFIQMEVTAGSSKVWNEGAAPGYALLGMRNGRVVSRVYRSIKLNRIQSLPSAGMMTATRLRWPFERIPYPIKLVQTHGQREGLQRFLANDVREHFAYVSFMEWSFPIADYQGKAREFLVLATVAASVRATVTVSFSGLGSSGPWTDVPLPPSDDGYVHRVPIPEPLLAINHLWIRFSTSLDRYGAGIGVSGWGFGSTPEVLTGYEKWISLRYRTISDGPETMPDAITPLSAFPNIVNFGFNLPTLYSGPQGASTALLPVSSLTGQPQYSKTPRDFIDFRFARRTADSNPGITYDVEESADLLNWTKVATERLAVAPLETGWEEVALIMPVRTEINGFCRVKVAGTDSIGGGFNTWTQQVAVAGGTPDDRNADGVSDLLQFAFDLGQDGNLRLYDPNRPNRKAGMPVQITGKADLSRIVFPRMRADSNPGVTYTVEASTDQRLWSPLTTREYSEQVIRRDGDWEEVEVIVLDAARPQRFYRIKLELESPLPS